MIYLITGGSRSGKSRYAQQLALKQQAHPIYLATARRWDQDFQDRISRHQTDRGDQWVNLEIEKDLSLISFTHKVVVVDCITLWLTNFFTDEKYDPDRTLCLAMEEMNRFLLIPNTLIFVTNEIGMGGHAATEVGRKFSDIQGWFNQFLAEKADQVILMVAGIPLVIK